MTVRRVVSLVPSLTEALVQMLPEGSVVGRTRYCVEPAGVVDSIEAVGGTKNPDVPRIVALKPDTVVVNREENRIEDYRALRSAGLDVFVTHPRTVAQAAEMLELLGAAVGAASAGRELATLCREAIANAREARAVHAGRALRTFCPIWKNPWMTFRDETYIGDMLACAGFENVFGRRQDADFFQVGLDEVLAGRPDVVLLPDEPYRFDSSHARELGEAGVEARKECLDGRDMSWYGPRIPRALARLTALRDEIGRAHSDGTRAG